ncbi:Os06g0306201, partial [Oryza sativa Japonica Group]
TDLLRGDVVDHLRRSLLRVPDDGQRQAAGVHRREREAPDVLVQEDHDPEEVELEHGAVAEPERHRRDDDLALAGEVVARVEHVVRRRRRVPLHGEPEPVPEQRVRLRREVGEDGAGVEEGAAASEHGRRHRQDVPADVDGDELDEVEGRELRLPQHRRVLRRAGVGGRRRADGEVPRRAVAGRQAVGEDGAERRGGLRRQRELAAAEAEEAVDAAEVAEVARAAPEREAGERPGGGERERVAREDAGGGRAVAVADEVEAGGVVLAAQVAGGRALGLAAVHGGVGGRLGRVEQRVLLRVAVAGGAARLALHPRQVAAGVEDERGRLRRRAEADGDDELQRVEVGPRAVRDCHGRCRRRRHRHGRNGWHGRRRRRVRSEGGGGRRG